MSHTVLLLLEEIRAYYSGKTSILKEKDFNDKREESKGDARGAIGESSDKIVVILFSVAATIGLLIIGTFGIVVIISFVVSYLPHSYRVLDLTHSQKKFEDVSL